MVRILLLSDTHSYIDNQILKFVKQADEVWHAGDIGDIKVTDIIKELKPLRAVYGNIDNAQIRTEFPLDNEFIIEGVSGLIQDHQWVFGIGLFVLSILLFSQAATVVTLMPVGVALDLPPELLIALYPAVNGFFFLPTYGTILAGVSFDQTGTTKIGKYLVNHSFMIPGLVTTFSAVVIALIISYFI